MWLVDPVLPQMHLYDFARDPVKAVRLVEDDETFANPVPPGPDRRQAEVDDWFQAFRRVRSNPEKIVRRQGFTRLWTPPKRRSDWHLLA